MNLDGEYYHALSIAVNTNTSYKDLTEKKKTQIESGKSAPYYPQTETSVYISLADNMDYVCRKDALKYDLQPGLNDVTFDNGIADHEWIYNPYISWHGGMKNIKKDRRHIPETTGTLEFKGYKTIQSQKDAKQSRPEYQDNIYTTYSKDQIEVVGPIVSSILLPIKQDNYPKITLTESKIPEILFSEFGTINILESYGDIVLNMAGVHNRSLAVYSFLHKGNFNVRYQLESLALGNLIASMMVCEPIQFSSQPATNAINCTFIITMPQAAKITSQLTQKKINPIVFRTKDTSTNKYVCLPVYPYNKKLAP